MCHVILTTPTWGTGSHHKANTTHGQLVPLNLKFLAGWLVGVEFNAHSTQYRSFRRRSAAQLHHCLDYLRQIWYQLIVVRERWAVAAASLLGCCTAATRSALQRSEMAELKSLICLTKLLRRAAYKIRYEKHKSLLSWTMLRRQTTIFEHQQTITRVVICQLTKTHFRQLVSKSMNSRRLMDSSSINRQNCSRLQCRV